MTAAPTAPPPELPADNPLFDPARHEPLDAAPWDAARVYVAIQHIVADAETRFTPEALWPPHPQDAEAGDPPGQPYLPLYFGACGMVWALHQLQDLGAATLQRDYRPYLPAIQQRNRAWLAGAFPYPGGSAGSYLMGDTPFTLMDCAAEPAGGTAANTLAALVEANMDHPARELMWGAPGTLLAALHMHRLTGDGPWADLFRRTAATLWSQLLWSDEYGCHYWEQDLYGQKSSYTDGAHGFVATALPLIQGRHLLAPQDWAGWQQRIVNTVQRTAVVRDGLANWRMWLGPMRPGRALLMQYCHGAPGFIICLAGLPGPELDTLLLQGGEAVWAAGPLAKGSNLCHGTGGNGYAFLKLHRRSGNPLWLGRAQAFAMHAIAQMEAAEQQHGQQRYSLWTGDVGLAFYLWDCLHGEATFPTLDRFFASAGA